MKFFCEEGRNLERESTTIPKEILDFEDACCYDEQPNDNGDIFGNVQGDGCEEIEQAKACEEIDEEYCSDVDAAQEKHFFGGFAFCQQH